MIFIKIVSFVLILAFNLGCESRPIDPKPTSISLNSIVNQDELLGIWFAKVPESRLKLLGFEQNTTPRTEIKGEMYFVLTLEKTFARFSLFTAEQTSNRSHPNGLKLKTHETFFDVNYKLEDSQLEFDLSSIQGIQNQTLSEKILAKVVMISKPGSPNIKNLVIENLWQIDDQPEIVSLDSYLTSEQVRKKRYKLSDGTPIFPLKFNTIPTTGYLLTEAYNTGLDKYKQLSFELETQPITARSDNGYEFDCWYRKGSGLTLSAKEYGYNERDGFQSNKPPQNKIKLNFPIEDFEDDWAGSYKIQAKLALNNEKWGGHDCPLLGVSNVLTANGYSYLCAYPEKKCSIDVRRVGLVVTISGQCRVWEMRHEPPVIHRNWDLFTQGEDQDIKFIGACRL